MLQKIVTRKLEIDEAKANAIEIRTTTTIIETDTNQVMGVTHHREVVDVEDDAVAQSKGVKSISDAVWTPAMKAKARELKAKKK